MHGSLSGIQIKRPGLTGRLVGRVLGIMQGSGRATARATGMEHKEMSVQGLSAADLNCGRCGGRLQPDEPPLEVAVAVVNRARHIDRWSRPFMAAFPLLGLVGQLPNLPNGPVSLKIKPC